MTQLKEPEGTLHVKNFFSKDPCGQEKGKVGSVPGLKVVFNGGRGL